MRLALGGGDKHARQAKPGSGVNISVNICFPTVPGGCRGSADVK